MKVHIEGVVKEINRDRHFSDSLTSSQDYVAGKEVAGIIGDTWINHLNESPVEQWTHIMKALRIHGISISFKE